MICRRRPWRRLFGTSLETLPEPVFFLDRAVARKTIEMLQQQAVIFHRHDDFFPQNTLDTEWLPEIGRRGWFVITQDQRIRYNPLEKLALLGSGVGAFILVGKNLAGAAQADCLRLALPRMRDFIARTTRPFIVKVYADGRIQQLKIT